jgi:hypothetical protein
MSNRNIIAIVALFVLGLIAFFYYNQKNRKEKKDWTETYKEIERQRSSKPYDLSLLRSCLNSSDYKTIDVDKKITRALPTEGTGSSYIFIGEGLRADTADYKALANYIQRGNDVFLASKYVANNLLKYIRKDKKTIHIKPKRSQQQPKKTTTSTPEEDEERRKEEEANAETNNSSMEDAPPSEPIEEVAPEKDNTQDDETLANEDTNEYDYEENYNADLLETFTDSMVLLSLSSPQKYQYTTGYFLYTGVDNRYLTDWSYLSEEAYLNFKYPVTLIGRVDSLTNCISVKYGSGNLFIHSNPILFTNIEIAQEDAKNYTANLFSLLRKGDIYWDNGNRTNVYEAMSMDHSGDNPHDSQINHQKTPLQYILSNQSLTWAWYSLLGMGVLFLIFSAKRRQRIVPVLAENTNTSLAFIKTIGRMYFNKQGHSELSQLQFKQWQWFVRERYGVKTNLLDALFAKNVAERSGLSYEKIKHLINAGQYINNYNTGKDGLIQFHKELDWFYKRCK